jgi:hypothetical protein
MPASSVLSFPALKGREIPTPAHYRPGDEYDIVELHDDSLLMAGFVKGCVFYVKVGHIFPGVPHLSTWQGFPRLGYVTSCNPHAFHWLSFDPLMPTGRYTRGQADLVGAVTEIWSFGLGPGCPRWLLDERTTTWIPARGFPPLIQLAN